MKNIKKIIVLGCLVTIFTGCSNQENNRLVNTEDTNISNLGNETKALEVLDTVDTINKKDKKDIMDRISEAEIIDVTEKMYVTYINDIYTNYENYAGKKIRIEGMFTSIYDEALDENFYFVYRTGPGCCGNDGAMCGLEFRTDGNIPEENDWIQVTGILTTYEEEGIYYLVLRDSEVVIKEERGLEVVYQ